LAFISKSESGNFAEEQPRMREDSLPAEHTE
jgi:hypothetical protein